MAMTTRIIRTKCLMAITYLIMSAATCAAVISIPYSTGEVAGVGRFIVTLIVTFSFPVVVGGPLWLGWGLRIQDEQIAMRWNGGTSEVRHIKLFGRRVWSYMLFTTNNGRRVPPPRPSDY